MEARASVPANERFRQRTCTPLVACIQDVMGRNAWVGMGRDGFWLREVLSLCFCVSCHMLCLPILLVLAMLSFLAC